MIGNVDASYEASASKAIEAGMADYEADRYAVGIDAAKAVVAEKRRLHSSGQSSSCQERSSVSAGSGA